MSESVQYQYTAELARKVYREVLFRRLGLMFALMVLGLAYLIWAVEGNKGFLWGVAFTLVTMYVAGFIGNERRAGERARSLSDPSITITFDDNGISHENVDHISTVKWRGLHSVTRLKSAWLFSIYSEDNYTAIPSDVITNSIKALIEKKMAENHKPIK